MMPDLQFIPTDEVVGAFEEMYGFQPPDCYQSQIGRRRPTYAINKWNMFQRFEDKLSKTNNSVEG